MDFERLGLCEELIKAVELEEWEHPTDCQEEAIPLILGGGDVLLAAPTGSGKTAAFGLPVLQIVWEMLQKEAPTYASEKTLCMNYCDSDEGISISGDGCTVSNSLNMWKGCRGTMSVSSKGKYYFECRMLTSNNGICRLGWSTSADSLNLGTTKTGYGFGGTGKKANGNAFQDYGESFKQGDVMGCCMDLDNGTISFTKNGKDLGIAYNHINRVNHYFPAICIKSCSVFVNFGINTPFLSLPAGYSPIPIQTNNTEPLAAERNILALILEPTRELAQQTYDCLNHFKAFMSNPTLSVGLLIGGERINFTTQKQVLKNHIVVATPNIFLDTVSKTGTNLNNLLFFILDEADKLVEDAQDNQLMRIFNRIPARSNENNEYRLQTCLFSATLYSDDIKQLSNQICKNPIWVDLKGRHYVPPSVQQVNFIVDVTDEHQRTLYTYGGPMPFTDGIHQRKHLGNVLKTADEKSEATKRAKLQIVRELVDHYKMSQVMIFCRTNLDCNNLEAYFNEVGNGQKLDAHHTLAMGGSYPCVVLAGMRDTSSRDFAIEAFRDGRARILICTDVAARGIDIKELPFVINMTLPDSIEQYFHRIGRVGRTGSVGLSFNLVSRYEEKVWYHTCRRKRSKQMECHNTKLTSEGGCCIWFNEMEMLQAIEKRMEMDIPELDNKLGLPPSIDLTSVQKTKNDRLIEVAAKNAQTIVHNVELLGKLENSIQSSYLSMISKSL